MIQLNELRVGNYVQWDNLSNHIDIITLGNISRYAHLKPLPITEDWLLYLGFVPCKLNQRFILGKFTYNVNSGWFFGGKKLMNQKYIHQLQNLYFALNQNELEYEK